MRPEHQTPTPIAAIVLAAGGSTRMGTSKQLLPIAGKPMVRLVVEAACDADLEQVVVVVGAGAQTVSDALAGLPVDIVVNDDWSLGLSTSLRAGIGTLRAGVQAVMVILGDQGALSARLLNSLVECYLSQHACIVAPVYAGRRANPVLFDRSLLPELLAVEGDEGGRSVIERHRDEVHLLDVDDVAVWLDVDTQADYERVLSLRESLQAEAARGP